MKRRLAQDLLKWKSRPNRRPLILRGSRQVGKTYLVSEIGKQFRTFLHVDFERRPHLSKVFQQDLDPKRILQELCIDLGQPFPEGETLLFLDEVQVEPSIIKSLRYFYEEMPDLHVIAAGSLLDPILEEIGVPVGRVEFLFLYPMNFLEVLDALGQKELADVIVEASPERPLSEMLHEKAMGFLKYYFALGGMPEVVHSWTQYHDWAQIEAIQRRLVQAYLQDFPKYGRRAQVKYMDLLFHQVPKMLGNKVNYSQVAEGYKKRELEPALELLKKAMVLHLVYHSSGNGLPLKAEANLQHFKWVGIDIALMQVLQGGDPKQWIFQFEQACINKGDIVESFVGQEILTYMPPDLAASLFYWNREKKNSLAEVDYLIAKSGQVLPIEVKSGHTQHLKSLHLFLKEHPQSPYGLHVAPHNYGKKEFIRQIPLYGIGSI